MGADQTVMTCETAMLEDRTEETPGVEATVTEILPRAVYRLELADRREVLAHAAGAARTNFVRLRKGDRVRVQLSSTDPTRGRIVKLL